MKRIFIILALLVLISAVFGCNARNKSDSSKPSEDTSDNGGNGGAGDGGNKPEDNGTIPDIHEKELTEAIKSLEDEGKYPKLDRSDNLLGIDNNNNGVRDDIDQFINNRPDTTPDQKQALKQEAKAFQYVLKIDLSNRTQVLEAAKQLSRANGCIFYRYAGKPYNELNAADKELSIYMFNTRDRYTKYEKFNTSLSGKAFNLEPSAESSCDRIN